MLNDIQSRKLEFLVYSSDEVLINDENLFRKLVQKKFQPDRCMSDDVFYIGKPGITLSFKLSVENNNSTAVVITYLSHIFYLYCFSR
jgi:hypothetical protein